MLQFLYPFGLLAAIGIIIPVIIHLWNIKNGKTLKIGSVALLGNPSNQRSRNFRVTDWPLLLLRCLLIFLIALLLAGPLFRSAVSSAEKPGWILIERAELGKVWTKNKAEIDSLLKNGYEIHDFNTGFQKIEISDTSTVFSKPAGEPLSYFSLIRQLNTQQAAGMKAYLYTDSHLNRFEGMQPFSSLDLIWKIAEDDSRQLTWTEKAFSLNKDQIRKITAHSSPSGTFYKREDVKKEDADGITVDPGDVKVLLFADDKQQDARYVKAAMRTIADFTQRKIEVKEIQSAAQITKGTDFVFWLSDKALSPSETKNLPAGISFFNYAGLRKEKVKSTIHLAAPPVPAALYQRTKYNGEKLQSVWTDGFGTPLLTVDSSGRFKQFQFYSRFNQDWTDLVWSNGLVMALMPLVLPDEEAADGFKHDKRDARAASGVPKLVRDFEKGKTAEVYDEQYSLSKILWWIILAVFLMERWIAYRKLERKL